MCDFNKDISMSMNVRLLSKLTNQPWNLLSQVINYQLKIKLWAWKCFCHSNFEQMKALCSAIYMFYSIPLCSDNFQVTWKMCRAYMQNFIRILCISWFMTRIFKTKVMDVFRRHTVCTIPPETFALSIIINFFHTHILLAVVWWGSTGHVTKSNSLHELQAALNKLLTFSVINNNYSRDCESTQSTDHKHVSCNQHYCRCPETYKHLSLKHCWQTHYTIIINQHSTIQWKTDLTREYALMSLLGSKGAFCS